MKKLLLSLPIITSLWVFPVCAKHNDTHDTHVTFDSRSVATETHTKNITDKIGDLVISKAFVRPTSKAGMSSAGYMTLTNNSDGDDTLISIQSDSVSRIEIHETKIDDNGVMSMTPIADGIVIPAKQSVEFKPRGLHFMLIDVTYPLVTETRIPITLSFKNSGTHKIDVTIANQVTSESCP